MKFKKINLILILSLTIFIFLALFLGMKSQNLYTTEHIINKTIPNFKSKELFTGEIKKLSQITTNDKFTVLNIWASWCAPCRSEHKHLIRLSYNKNSKIIGLNYKDKIDNAKSFISELGNPYDYILLDNKGFISIDIGAYGVPETYIIENINNKIIKKYLGPIDEFTLKEILTILNS